MYKTTFLIFSLIIITVGISSCATIFGKSKYPVSISSTPPAASILIINNKKQDTVFRGTTPSIVKLKASNGYFQRATYTIKISAAGYSEQTISLKATINGFYFGNLLIGGLLGMLVVDPLTGRMWVLPINASHINTELKSENLKGSIEIKELKDVSYKTRMNLVSIN